MEYGEHLRFEANTLKEKTDPSKGESRSVKSLKQKA